MQEHLNPDYLKLFKQNDNHLSGLERLALITQAADKINDEPAPSLASKPMLPSIIAPSAMQIIQVRGDKSQAFLQGQLSCDVDQLKPGCTLPGAYCDHRGRMLANFLIQARDNGYDLLMQHSLIAGVCATLQKYAVFSRVEVQPASTKSLVFVHGSHHNLQQLACEGSGKSEHTNWQCWIPPTGWQSNQAFMWLSFNPDTCIQDFLSQACEQEPAACLTTTNLETASCVQAHIGWVTQATCLKWTPHMLNWQHHHGVSFTKGCFVGQEIIARTENLGRLKRHLYFFKINTEQNLKLTPGAELHNAQQQTLGALVNTYQLQNQCYGLAVIEDRALGQELFIHQSLLHNIRQTD